MRSGPGRPRYQRLLRLGETLDRAQRWSSKAGAGGLALVGGSMMAAALLAGSLVVPLPAIFGPDTIPEVPRIDRLLPPAPTSEGVTDRLRTAVNGILVTASGVEVPGLQGRDASEAQPGHDPFVSDGRSEISGPGSEFGYLAGTSGCMNGANIDGSGKAHGEGRAKGHGKDKAKGNGKAKGKGHGGRSCLPDDGGFPPKFSGPPGNNNPGHKCPGSPCSAGHEGQAGGKGDKGSKNDDPGSGKASDGAPNGPKKDPATLGTNGGGGTAPGSPPSGSKSKGDGASLQKDVVKSDDKKGSAGGSKQSAGGVNEKTASSEGGGKAPKNPGSKTEKGIGKSAGASSKPSDGTGKQKDSGSSLPGNAQNSKGDEQSSEAGDKALPEAASNGKGK